MTRRDGWRGRLSSRATIQKLGRFGDARGGRVPGEMVTQHVEHVHGIKVRAGRVARAPEGKRNGAGSAEYPAVLVAVAGAVESIERVKRLAVLGYGWHGVGVVESAECRPSSMAWVISQMTEL